MWVLALQQMKDITNHPDIKPNTTMRQVVETVIKPATKGLGISYALVVNQEQPLRAKVMVSVSTLQLIVSFYIQLGYSLTLSIFYCFLNYFITYLQHAWEEPIDELIECLERSGEMGPFWVCAFSIHQNHGNNDKPTIAEQLGPNPEYGPFTTVLRQANIMIAVVTELCDIYTRLWYVQPN